MSIKLYVGNLAFTTGEDDLQRLFSQVGSVESVSMITDRGTGRSRGFAFVEMSSKSEGEAAISKFNGAELDGRSLTVNEAKPRENRIGNRGGSNRGGNNRSSGSRSAGGRGGGGRSRF
jgi:RNA recognition motif-containing protein